MYQILDRVVLYKSLKEDEYLAMHQDIARKVLSNSGVMFKSLSAIDYSDTHGKVIGRLIEANYSGKNEKDYLIEHEKMIREISSKDTLKYPIDEYLKAHEKIIRYIKQSFNNWSLVFTLSNDKYLCIFGRIDEVAQGMALSDYKLLFKNLCKKEYLEKHKDLVLKIRKEIDFTDIYLEAITEKTSLIREIISRVEKRKVYFHLFHNGLEMGELNEIALYCFWILKFQPFKLKHDKITATRNTNKVNVLIAVYLFLAAVKTAVNKKKGTNYGLNISNEFLKNLVYSFKYQDLSKEAIMGWAKCLLEA